MMTDLDVLKEIPGYKAILKSVLKSQVQLLLEQLSEQTGEESIILTASITDGALSHLGSSTGKGFLEGRDDLKSQFLGYCLKTFHRSKTQDQKSHLQRRSHPRPCLQPPSQPEYQPPTKHPRFQSVALSNTPISRSSNLSGRQQDKIEKSPSHNKPENIDSNIGLEMTSARPVNEDSGQIKAEDNTDDINSGLQDVGEQLEQTLNKSNSQENISPGSSDQTLSSKQEMLDDESDVLNLGSSSIKIEPITENEMELEITGVEPGDGFRISTEDWGQGQMSRRHSSGVDEGSYSDQKDEFMGYGNATLLTPTSYSSPSSNAPHNFSSASPSNNHICFHCPTCYREFRTRQNLARHMMIHTGEKPYRCDFCEKSFRMRHHLVGHIRTIHHVLLR